MAFVTKYKLKRVLGNIDGDLSNDPIRIYFAGKYYYLSDKETNKITVYFRFLENPKTFIEQGNFKWTDTKRNAVEIKPAYHNTDACQALSKRFDNVILPSKIQSNDILLSEARQIAERLGLYTFGEKTKDELERFVIVCMEEMNHSHQNLQVKIDDFKIVHNKKNSGSKEYSNLSIQEIKDTLDNLVKESNEYFGFNDKRQLVLPTDFFKKPFSYPEKLNKHNRLQVLEKYRYYLSLIADKENLINNYTDFCSDEDVIKIAKEIHNRFKKPTVSAIESELLKKVDKKEFGKTVLEILGFHPCGGCSRHSTLTDEDKQYINKYKIK